MNSNHVEKWKNKIVAFYDKYFGTDTNGWIIMLFFYEIVEIIIQSQALLVYNGYNVFDPNNANDIYLANKPEFIILFSLFLGFNCLLAGILWLFYVCVGQICHGAHFKIYIFFVDQFCDLLYTLFPFMIILYDDYNNKNNNNILVLLGQLNTSSNVAFLSSFIPLFLLCNKCLLLTKNSINSLRTQCYNEWNIIQNIAKQSKDKDAVYVAKLHGHHLTDDTHIKTEIFDDKGKLIINIHKYHINNKSICFNCNKKNILILFVSLLYILYGVGIIVFTNIFITDSQHYCQ
eukprot:186066_1